MPPWTCSVAGNGSFWQRLCSREGLTSVSATTSSWSGPRCCGTSSIGLLIAGAAAAWIPDSFWQSLFFTDHPLAAKIWGPIIGPLVAVLAFVCSIGNVPLAAVLWNGGISFGGVVSFIFADLIIMPIIVIYAKYYGRRDGRVPHRTFYADHGRRRLRDRTGLRRRCASMPTGPRHASVGDAGISWNYTTWLNIVFLLLAAALVVRFVRTGGREMLAMMGGGPHDMADHGPGGRHGTG